VTARARCRRLLVVVGIAVLAGSIVATAGSVVAAKTYPERETPHHPANTFRDHHRVSGKGPPVAAGRVVRVSCRVYDPSIRSVSPAGYWYRIASPPWNNRYYAPANTFLNGDRPNGPYRRNVDRRVPKC
jgi:hypothetical protein